MDYILTDETCSDYLQSLKDRQFYDREFIDIFVIIIWCVLFISLFSFTMRFQLQQILAYSSQFMIGRLSYKNQTDDFEIPSLLNTPPLPNQTSLNQHTFSNTSLGEWCISK